MADEVPAEVGEVGEGAGLLDELLRVVLAEVTEAKRVGFANGVGRVRLRHGDEEDRIGPASGTLGGAGDSRTDGVDAIAKRHSREPYHGRASVFGCGARACGLPSRFSSRSWSG